MSADSILRLLVSGDNIMDLPCSAVSWVSAAMALRPSVDSIVQPLRSRFCVTAMLLSFCN